MDSDPFTTFSSTCPSTIKCTMEQTNFASTKTTPAFWSSGTEFMERLWKRMITKMRKLLMDYFMGRSRFHFRIFNFDITDLWLMRSTNNHRWRTNSGKYIFSWRRDRDTVTRSQTCDLEILRTIQEDTLITSKMQLQQLFENLPL